MTYGGLSLLPTNAVQEGVITYHRTDGVTIGQDALEAIREIITDLRYGPEYLAKPLNVHKWVSLILLFLSVPCLDHHSSSHPLHLHIGQI